MATLIECKDIVKVFGPTRALDGANLQVNEGEILSLLGENGSGKTTLMNVLSGLYFPEEGQVLYKGEPIVIASPHDAFSYRIGMVHQHFKLVEVFTAIENIVLGLTNEDFARIDKDHQYKGKNGGYNIKLAAQRVKRICDQFGFKVDPNKKVYEMSVSEKQTLEIVKVLYRGVDVLILDEPTAVLTPQEADQLFAVLRNMKAAGKSIIIITHKLNEVLGISDRVSVLCKGRTTGEIATSEANESILTEMMVGKKVELNIDRKDPVNPKKKLSVKNLTVKNKYGLNVIDDISFDINGGEILGIAGISGCGQKELLEAIAGLQKCEKGASICFFPKKGEPEELIGLSPKKIRNMGVSLSFVPEDRLGMGLVGSYSMVDNILLRSYDSGKSPVLSKRNPTKLAKQLKKELEIATPSIYTPVKSLSGGNVQKVLVGREIASSPEVLMTAYAVRGLDINSSYIIYRLLNEQKAKGTAVVYVGEDLDVLLALSDRILVLCEGKNNGILDARTTDKNTVGYLMTNLKEGN